MRLVQCECSKCGMRTLSVPNAIHRRCMGYKRKNPKPRDLEAGLLPKRKRGVWQVAS